MAEATLTTPTVRRSIWSGGRSPFKVSWGKLMMWYFLVGDSFSFASFLITYGALRFSYDSWPLPTKVFEAIPFFEGVKLPLAFVSFMTFTLIMSSVTMVLAVYYGTHDMNRQKVAKWLFFTIIGGITFLCSQAWEWTHLHAEGAWWGRNPFLNIDGTQSTTNFTNYFFTITGFHGFHVFSGVIINIIMLIKTWRGDFERTGHYLMIEKAGLYWHFVDLVWVFVFTCFYLL
jgi:cytochrome c oxidase subunit 3